MDALVEVRQALLQGLVIPAHPLALKASGQLDEQHQQALTRYYHAAGAGGLAVGVHTTQFAIRDVGLLDPVLTLASETTRACDALSDRQTIVIAGVCGKTNQAVAEAALARERGYHVGLLSLSALATASVDELIEHCRAVAEVLPIMGFYLQPAVGGRVLPLDFWHRFAEIPNVVAIKVAPFNRYQTLDVIRAVADVGRADEIALYTGNDDHILLDLISTYKVPVGESMVEVRFSGGLLGHWACWTKQAVEHLALAKRYRAEKQVPAAVLTLAAHITDANAALFDAANGFAGCIAGIHAVLHRQGLLAHTRCLNPNETLSAGQAEAIDRIYTAHPHLNDDAFVAENLDDWLRS